MSSIPRLTEPALRKWFHAWEDFPGDENRISDVPMCPDPMWLQWMIDIKARKPKPTNTAPRFIYMLRGAMQHSNTDPFDRVVTLVIRRGAKP